MLLLLVLTLFAVSVLLLLARVAIASCVVGGRALMYHSRMLKTAKEFSNLNEFVYLAKEISRMLKEEVSGSPRLLITADVRPCL